MADSGRMNTTGGADYARPEPSSASPQASVSAAGTAAPAARRFRPRRWPTLAAVLLLPLFLAAGQWQWTKAGLKSAEQRQLDARGAESAITMAATPVDGQLWRYRKIVARGYYEPRYQILVDNRTLHEQAGYHVITPLRLEGSEMRLLVNRGWVPALAEHRQSPQVETPAGIVEVRGTSVVPGTRFLTLGAESVTSATSATTGTPWQGVWQNLDMPRYARAVPFPIQPVVIELDPLDPAGGFVREWPRADQRIFTNLGYALQWWTFAAMTVVLWLLLNFRRPT